MRASTDSPELTALREQMARRERFEAHRQAKYTRRLELPRQRVTRRDREPVSREALRWAVTWALVGALAWSLVVLAMMRWWWSAP